MPPDLVLRLTLSSSNYPRLELTFMVPKVFKPYRKNSKYWDTQTKYRSCPKYKTVYFYNEVIPPKDVERMANSVDPDQTAP